MHLSTIPNSKILKKGVQIGPKLKRGLGTQESHSALLECRLVLPKCWLAQIYGSARGLPDWDKAYLFRFFRDKDVFQFISYLIEASQPL